MLPRKKFFPLRIDPFVKGLFPSGNKQEITKVVLPCKNCMKHESVPFNLNYP